MVNHASPPVPPDLVELAPSELPRARDRRYVGEGFAVTLLAFPTEVAACLERIYAKCRGYYRAWLDECDGPGWPEVHERFRALRDGDLISDARALGETLDRAADPRLGRVIHDVRGGALSALVTEASIMDPDPPAAELGWLAELARDHAKMMRQGIVDLDREGRAADEREKQHDVGPIVEKWTGRQYRLNGSVASIETQSRYTGGLASCCLEAATVDRVLYNLINNATRFASDGRVTLDIFPVGRDIRFVVGNGLTDEHLGWLRTETDGEPTRLFEGGITRRGHGIGLANCAILVAAAYGQPGPENALETGHLGAQIRDRRFLAWFHWPSLDDQ